MRDGRWHSQHRDIRVYTDSCVIQGLRAGRNAVLSHPGSSTPGVDGITTRHIDSRTEGRERLVQQLHEERRHETSRPQPGKRVYIPKAHGKKRPLGIACLRDRAVQATVQLVLEPIYDSVFPPCSWGFRPRRATPHALSAVRRGPAAPKLGFQWISEGDMASGVDAIAHRLLRRILQKRRQDRQLLPLLTRLLRGGIWEEGQVRSPQTGTVQGSVRSPVLAHGFLHAFDDWYVRTSRVRPAWAHLAPPSIAYRRRKTWGGTLMLTRYADGTPVQA